MVKRTAIAAPVFSGNAGSLREFFRTARQRPDRESFGIDRTAAFRHAEPPATLKLGGARPRATIYLPGESSFTGRNRPAMSIDRDGTEKLVREAAERHRVDRHWFAR